MGITLTFGSFEEMTAYARQLLGVTPEVKKEKPVKQETVKQEKIEVAEEETTVPGEEEKTFTLEEVRAKLAELTKGGKKDEVKALFAEFSVTKLSEVKESDYAALMEKAGAL